MQLTREQAVAKIVALTPLSEADVNGLLDCSLDELAMILKAIKGRGKMPSASAWDVVLDVLKTCAAVAAVVTPLAGAINSVYGLSKL